MDDDMTPVAGPPQADPRIVALGFALEVHRPESRAYSDDADTILVTADKILQWLTAPGTGQGDSYTPLWALHTQRMIQQVLNRMGVEMATLADIQNTVNELVATDGTIVTALDDLKAKLAAGGTVSSADLDAVNSTIQGELAKLQDAVNRDDPPAPGPSPAPAPTTGP